MLLLSGLSEIRAGRLDAARVSLERQRKIYDPGVPPHVWDFHVLEGEIALAAGNLAAAEAAFSASEPAFKPGLNDPFFGHLPFRDGLARVKAARGDLKGAIDIYRQLITPDISQKWTTVLEPRFVLELAKLLERNGDRTAAREHSVFWSSGSAPIPGCPSWRKPGAGWLSCKTGFIAAPPDPD